MPSFGDDRRAGGLTPFDRVTDGCVLLVGQRAASGTMKPRQAL
jgi:hypothetical protein